MTFDQWKEKGGSRGDLGKLETKLQDDLWECFIKCDREGMQQASDRLVEVQKALR